MTAIRTVVTVGTDHHRFDRLMDWLDRWHLDHPHAVEWIVQHGASRSMQGIEGFPMVSRPQLLAALSTSRIVVTQGGPGGIMDSRDCGIVPIVVPRLARFDEVVDDHQVAFCRHLARRGLIVLAETEQELRQALDRACADPESLRCLTDGHQVVAASVARFEALVADLVSRKPPRRSRRRHRLTAAG